MMIDDILMHQQNEMKKKRVDEWRTLLPVVEGWARGMYEPSGWGSRWEWVEFFSNKGTWHSLIGGDGPGEGWWGADEEEGREGGSSDEEEVGGSGRPEGWRGEKGKGAIRQNRWQWVTVKQASVLTQVDWDPKWVDQPHGHTFIDTVSETDSITEEMNEGDYCILVYLLSIGTKSAVA